MTAHTDWYDELTDHAPRTPAAEKAGISQSTLHNQMNRGRLSVETVLALARAYGRNPVIALAETGYVTPDEVEVGKSVAVAAFSLDQISDKRLIAEFMRRINKSPAAWGFTLGEEPEFDSNGQVSPIRPARDDEPPRRVADSSPDHPEESSEFDD